MRKTLPKLTLRKQVLLSHLETATSPPLTAKNGFTCYMCYVHCACASCAMPTADKSNHSDVGTPVPHTTKPTRCKVAPMRDFSSNHHFILANFP